MNKFVKFSIYFLVISGIILLVLPVRWFPPFYDVRYMGVAALVCAAAIVYLPKPLRVPADSVNAEKKNRIADFFQLIVAIAVTNNALGDMGMYELYKVGFQYDKVIHFGNSFLAVLIISIILHERFGLRASYAVLVAFLFVVACGFLWELFEFMSDVLFKTHIYGVYGTDKFNDTKWDLISNIIGAAVGSVFMVFRNRRKVGV